MIKQTLGFTLGREEIVLLLRLLGYKTIPGLGDDPLAGMSEGEIATAMLAAEHSLRGRGFLRGVVTPDGEARAEYDPVVAALVGSCIVPDISFLATCRTAQGEEARYYHIRLDEQVIVEHAFPGRNLHSFRSFDSRGEIAGAICDVLRVDRQPALPGAAGRVLEDTLNKAREQASRDDLDAAISILTTSGLPQATARGIAETVSQPLANGSVVRITHKSNTVKGFAALEGPGGLCILAPDGSDADPWVRIEPASAQEIRARIEALCSEE